MDKPQRKILIMDDSAEDRGLFRQVLQQDADVTYLFEEANSGNRGLAVYQTFQPDCLLLDYRLPDLDGLQVLERLHKQTNSQTPAVIMLTGIGNEAVAVEAMKRGAQDYLVKDRLTLSRLRSAVANAIEKVTLGRTLEAQHQQLLYQAEILDQTHDAIITTDLDAVVMSWNKGAERLFGYTATEMIGHPALMLFPQELHEQFSSLVLAPLRERGQQDLQVRQHHRSGKELYVHVSLSFLRDKSEVPTGIIGYVIDITAHKQTEETLIRQTAELLRINDELQQFSYVVSHDLNEPLRTIVNFLDLLSGEMSGQLTPKEQEYIGFVRDGAQRMQQMITDLLAYTRAGRAVEQFTFVDCDALLARVLADLQLVIRESGATITHDPLPTLQGDTTRLGQVLQNLIGNAIKFRGQEPPRIHISAQHKAQHWQFCVHDNGIGIDPAQTKRLFQVFQRLHTRTEYSGTGIGLAICRKIVEQHGGQIWVESTIGNGASFFFTIGST